MKWQFSVSLGLWGHFAVGCTDCMHPHHPYPEPPGPCTTAGSPFSAFGLRSVGGCLTRKAETRGCIPKRRSV